MRTRLGQFPIGFRRGWGSWQQQSVSGLAVWAAEVGFEFLDLMNVNAEEILGVERCGVRIGTIDLLQYGRLLSSEEEVQQTTVAANLDMISKQASAGVRKFFACLMGDSSRSRIDNFRMATSVMLPICQAASRVNATVAIEGFPGTAPNYLGIGCTPETVRVLLREIPEGLSLNYDPSHLIRQGIDPIQFLREFVSQVGHVHVKDTELNLQNIYEFGLYQDSTFQPLSPARRYAGHTWNYRLPGRGVADWKQILTVLADHGYSGGVSIELEDEDFLGTEQLEKEGLIASRDFIANLH